MIGLGVFVVAVVAVVVTVSLVVLVAGFIAVARDVAQLNEQMPPAGTYSVQIDHHGIGHVMAVTWFATGMAPPVKVWRELYSAPKGEVIRWLEEELRDEHARGRKPRLRLVSGMAD